MSPGVVVLSCLGVLVQPPPMALGVVALGRTGVSSDGTVAFGVVALGRLGVSANRPVALGVVVGAGVTRLVSHDAVLSSARSSVR